MKKIISLIVVCVFLFGWKLEVDENFIKVYTQKQQNSPYVEFKAETDINCPKKLKKELLNFKDYPKWQKKIKKIEVYNGYMLKVLDFPFPYDDRFAFYKIEVSQKPVFKIKLTSIPFANLPENIKKHFKKPEGVEIKDNVSFEVDKNRFIYSAAVDRLGVAAFLFNSKMPKAAYSTVYNLKLLLDCK